MHTFRYRVALRSKGHGFCILITKNVLQLFHNFIFELRVLLGIDCLGWSDANKYPFGKSSRNGPALSYPGVPPAQQIE